MFDVTVVEEVAVLAAALLCRALVGLELDELLGHVVVVALGQDAQDGQSGFVHVDAFAQRQPAGGAAFGGHVLQLQDGHAHGAVLSGEAVVLHTHLELVALRAHLAAQGAAGGVGGGGREVNRVTRLRQQQTSKPHRYSQSERFVVFGGPAVVLGLGGVLPLLVAEVGADNEDLHKRTKYPLSLPTQVVGSHH